MYRTIIDTLIAEDDALNYEAKYIALDLDTFVIPYKDNQSVMNNNKYLPISDNMKNNLLNYCKKYNSEIKSASFADLKAQGLFNEETVSLEGLLIYVSNIEKLSENKAIISMVKYRSGLGALFPKYELNYENDIWEIKVLEMAIS